MGFNYGLEKKNFDRQWAIMRKQYEDAGMSIEVIQAMYEYDWSVFNAARSYQNHTQEITAPSFEQGEESYSPLMNKYQEAISVTEHYRETKSRFTWIGEIENERLLSALENLSDADLNLVTMYAYEGYTVTEISKVLGVAQPTISIIADICQQIQIPVNSTKTDIRKILFNMQINSVGSGMLFC